MNLPEDLRYTSDHEWVRSLGNGQVRIGITDFAQDAMGDVVFVQLPELAKAEEGASVAEIESTKSVSDVYCPLNGTIVAVNDKLSDAPETLNSDPYGEGWIFELELADQGALEGLMDAAAYRATLNEE